MTTQQAVKGRFAPSPSGRMHLGNLWSCLLAWLAAHHAGGTVALRLEDLDPQRCTQAHCDQVMRDLDWLGLGWDGTPVYQSQRTPIYAQAFAQLQGRGLLYPCYCSRAQRLAASAPHQSDGIGVYQGRCRALTGQQHQALAQHHSPAWRVCVPQETVSFRDLLQGEYQERLDQDCGDFIVRRGDGVYAYQLAVVVDDGEMGINQVVRGKDLLSSTPRQLWLQGQLGLPHPQHGHVPLLLAPDGRRLAKRDGDQELGQLKLHYTAPELVGRLAVAAGLLEEYAPVTSQELIPLFSWDKLPREDIVFSLSPEET